MKIQSMFKEDVNRKINGVVKVGQSEDDVLVQELDEYVITDELKKHFITFFNNYDDAFDEPTDNIGVWISGFFGSGKSHFLKMLSYLLANREVQGVRTVERFRTKFADDPGTFLLVDRATRNPADTILFNIDIEGSINKDKTAVLRVFAKMFYNYLGFYGENLKVAKLEQFIDKKGQTNAFRQAFEKKNGAPWLEMRSAYTFLEDDVVAALMETLGMSEQAARNWFNGDETVETSVAQLVSEIKEYVERQPKEFRLLFMIDEVGQYVGGDTDLLLNLQSLAEEIGRACMEKVWIVCTGQEAIDEIIKTREDEFSRIQARFSTRLSLSSSSADEVIQKRILQKTEKGAQALEKVYAVNDSVLRNLFSFTGAVKDVKGYSGSVEFVKTFPFVPYQFILLQKVFAEIRKHGNSGKHLSGGERSMLSGFQEAAQKIKDQDEYALAPFHLFYDTVHTFLDSSIRQVVERCERAARDDAGIKPQDVEALKLLYLVRYLNDVPANLDNIVILMADKIQLDKVAKREQVRDSLDRLLSQNYIGRSGDVYNFLTDEEQDIQREIRKTPVATADVVSKIAQTVFEAVYTIKKYQREKYVFPFDRMVDGQTVGATTGGMTLQLLTVATDPVEKDKTRLLIDSAGKAVVVLAENRYYETLESVMKIRKYVKTRNISQLPKSSRDIIQYHQDEAQKLEEIAKEELEKAIENAEFYIDGERVEIKSGDAKSKLDQALSLLVDRVYDDLGLIVAFAESDADVGKILRGDKQYFSQVQPNQDAAARVAKHLELQDKLNLPTTMFDLKERFQKKPYGWREIDVAAVVAILIHDQKVVVKYGGETIRSDNPKLPDMLRKKSEIGKTTIAIRKNTPIQKIKETRDFMRDFFDKMDVPEDEDGLVAYIVKKFGEERARYDELVGRYAGHNYPDRDKVEKIVALIKDLLSQQKDNNALIQRVIDRQNALYDTRDALRDVEDFFKTRVNLFDAATEYAHDLMVDGEYIDADATAKQTLAQIQEIVAPPAGSKFPYKRIPELNGLMATLKASHGEMLEVKRAELSEIARQCQEEIDALVAEKGIGADVAQEAKIYYEKKREQIASYATLALLNGLSSPMWQYKDKALLQIEACAKPSVAPSTPEPGPEPKTTPSSQPTPKKENVKLVHRQTIFPAKTLKTESEIDDYVENIRAKMKEALKGCDGIKLN